MIENFANGLGGVSTSERLFFALRNEKVRQDGGSDYDGDKERKVMKKLCAIVVLSNPLISFVNMWHLYKRRGDEILRKRSLF